MTMSKKNLVLAISAMLLVACESKLGVKVAGNTRSDAETPKKDASQPAPIPIHVFNDPQKNLVWSIVAGDQSGFSITLQPGSFDPPLTISVDGVIDSSPSVPYALKLSVDKPLKFPMTITLPNSVQSSPTLKGGFYVRIVNSPVEVSEILPSTEYRLPGAFQTGAGGPFEILPMPEISDFEMSDFPSVISDQNFIVQWVDGIETTRNDPETTFNFSLNTKEDCSDTPAFEQKVISSPAEVKSPPEGTFYACLGANWHNLRHKKDSKKAQSITIDRTPPVVAAITAGLVTTESVSLTWASSDALSGIKSNRLYYAQVASLNTLAEILANGTPVTLPALESKASVGGLSLGQIYYFNVIAEDQAGNISVGMPISVAVIPNVVTNISGAVETASPGSGAQTYLGSINGKMMYAANSPLGRELFISDGTQAGTSLVKDINPGPGDSTPSYPGVLGSILLFTAENGSTGQELWRTDGTSAGTWMVKDLEPGAIGSNPQAPLPFGAFALFSATTAAEGMELWRTDGTEAGTYMVTDNCPGPCSGAFYVSNYLSQANVLNGKLLFLGADSVNDKELWSSDGTALGTVLVRDINAGSSNSSESVWYNMTQYNGSVYFAAVTNASGSELWRSDGTFGGTYMVKEIYAGNSNAYPGYVVETGGKLVFRATDGVNGTELWVSDGTSLGTNILKDINPGATGGFPDWIATAGGIAYFKADDGVNGSELWRSDGTAPGTYMVTDLTPAGSSFIQGMYPFGNKMVFQNNALGLGQEFWITDGTGPGTFLLKDINPDYRHSSAIGGIVHAGKMYFSASHDFYGSELWVTDGTTTGTQLAVDFYGGSSQNQKYVTNGARAMFIGYEPTSGFEPWLLTANSAGLLKDVNPGSGSSLPSNIVSGGTSFFFDAFDPIYGQELWRSDGTGAGTSLVKRCHYRSGQFDLFGDACSEQWSYLPG